MDTVKSWLGYDSAPVEPVKPKEAEHKIPFELSTWITLKCFDTCISDFSDKNLVGKERYCIKECTGHLLTSTVGYQTTQEYAGFSKSNASTQNPGALTMNPHLTQQGSFMFNQR